MRIDLEEGFGFIAISNGRELYFSRGNSVHPRFEQLEHGTIVQCIEGPGDNERQVKRVSSGKYNVALQAHMLVSGCPRRRGKPDHALIDARPKRVLASQLFDESENAPTDDAYGGVTAANAALQRVLEQVAAFCVVESGRR